MLETVVVAAIVIAAFGLVFRSFYRSFTHKEDDHIFGGICAGACEGWRAECCQQPSSDLSRQKTENRVP